MPRLSKPPAEFLEPFDRPDWHQRTPHLWRRLLRSAVFDLIGLLVLVTAGELAVRTWVDDSGRFLYSRTLTAGHPIELGRHGLREREFPVRRPPGQIRILCVGDSVTFGAGVAVEDAWPRQLERTLTAQDPRFPNAAATGGLLVINAATQGKPLSRAIAFVRTDGVALDPSLVVVGFSPAMIGRAFVEIGAAGHSRGSARLPTTTSAGGLPSAIETVRSVVAPLCAIGRRAFELLHERSHAYTLAAAHYRDLLVQLGIRHKAVDDPNGGLLAYAFDSPAVDFERVERAHQLVGDQLNALKADLDALGIALVVVSVPSRFELSDQPADNEFGLDRARIRIRPHERLGRFCRQLGVTFIDLLPPLQQRRTAMLSDAAAWNDLYVELDYAHLNEAGCRVAAEALSRALLADQRLAAWRAKHIHPRPQVAEHEAGDRRLR